MIYLKIPLQYFSSSLKSLAYSHCPIKIEPTIGLDQMHGNPNSIDLLPIGTPNDLNSSRSSLNHSPQSQHSQQGAPPMDPMMMPRKKSKKGPAPKLFGNEKCKICESRATGFHYNVLSCEACKVSLYVLIVYI